MMAVREGRFTTAELLVARGADVNHRNQNGANALDWAKRNNDTQLVARLRRAGARD
jgi:ankyrin repeat protein